MKRDSVALQDVVQTYNELHQTALPHELCEAISEAKGSDIHLYDMAGASDIANYYLIASGRSDRQVQGMAQRVLSACDRLGIEVLHVEGVEKSHWILIDTGDVVVHLFYEPARADYALESLWSSGKRVQ